MRPDSRLHRVMVSIPRKLSGLPALMYESVTGSHEVRKDPLTGLENLSRSAKRRTAMVIHEPTCARRRILRIVLLCSRNGQYPRPLRINGKQIEIPYK